MEHRGEVGDDLVAVPLDPLPREADRPQAGGAERGIALAVVFEGRHARVRRPAIELDRHALGPPEAVDGVCTALRLDANVRLRLPDVCLANELEKAVLELIADDLARAVRGKRALQRPDVAPPARPLNGCDERVVVEQAEELR